MLKSGRIVPAPQIPHEHYAAGQITDGITRLVHFEVTPNVRAAIAREKQVKSWARRKKVLLIEKGNPEWTDLSVGWFDGN